MKVRKRIKRLILVIAATLIAYLFLVPLLFMVFTSFKGLSESISSSELLPKMWTLRIISVYWKIQRHHQSCVGLRIRLWLQ